MKLETVTGEIIELSEWGAYSLNYIIECGRDWVADVSIVDGAKPENYRKARVFASKNPGVQHLMQLAHKRGKLDAQDATAENARRDIAELKRQLAEPGLTESEREDIQDTINAIGLGFVVSDAVDD